MTRATIILQTLAVVADHPGAVSLNATSDQPEDTSMARYQIIDPEINAKCDIVYATDPDSAIDAHVRKMGWDNYQEFMKAASHHSGVRGFMAEAIPMPQVPMLKAA